MIYSSTCANYSSVCKQKRGSLPVESPTVESGPVSLILHIQRTVSKVSNVWGKSCFPYVHDHASGSKNQIEGLLYKRLIVSITL